MDNTGDIDGYIPGARVTYVNEAGITESQVEDVLNHKDVATQIEQWMKRLRSEQSGGPAYDGVFKRSHFVGSDNFFMQLAQCAAAVEGDDVLSTLADTVEALTFQRVRFEMNDEDQEDVWNQWAAHVDLDSRMREMFRETFKVSQAYVGVNWDRMMFRVSTPHLTKEKVKGVLEGESPGKGNRTRRKEFAVVMPSELTILDPTKVVPIGQLMFGRERFAYIADRHESASFESVFRGDTADPFVLRMVERKYEATQHEKTVLGDMGIDVDRLWLFRQHSVFRHTATRAQYERFAVPRLKSVLPLLDLKRHLREADRAALVGNTNFLVLIRKGTDKLPAKSAEIENLQRQARTVARTPILVGDHRLMVDIVTPPSDYTLQRDRHDLLDSRLVFRALQSFSPTQRSANSSGSIEEVSRVVAMGLEARRHMMMRSMEKHLFRVAVDVNETVFDERPKLAFTPKRIALDFNQVIANTVLKLRDRGDLSRETVLEEFDYDQSVEASRRLAEHDVYDDVFQSQVPHSSPGSNPFTDGNQGGRPVGATDSKPRRKPGQED